MPRPRKEHGGKRSEEGAKSLSLLSGHESHILKIGIEGSNLQDIRWLLPCPLREGGKGGGAKGTRGEVLWAPEKSL